MQDLIEFVQAHSALVGQSYRIVADQRPDCREPGMRAISAGRLRRKTCGPPRTGTVGPASRPAAGAMLTLLRLSG